MKSIGQRIAEELNAQEWQVEAAIALLDGARRCRSSPATARKRPGPRRHAAAQAGGAAALPARARGAPRGDPRSDREQGKLTTPLAASSTAPTPRRGWRTSISLQAEAPHQGADRARGRPRAAGRCAARRPDARPGRPRPLAFVDAAKGVADAKAALDGARAILIERFAEDADLVGALRELYVARAAGSSRRCATARRRTAPSSPTISTSPSARQDALASMPGAVPRREGRDPRPAHDRRTTAERRPGIAEPVRAAASRRRFGIADRGRPGRPLAGSTPSRWTWRTKLRFPHRDRAAACGSGSAPRRRRVKVFARNLHDLLLAAPAGPRATMGLDPGCAPASRWRWSTPPARCVATDDDLPARAAATTGTRRSPMLARCAARTRWS